MSRDAARDASITSGHLVGKSATRPSRPGSKRSTSTTRWSSAGSPSARHRAVTTRDPNAEVEISIGANRRTRFSARRRTFELEVTSTARCPRTISIFSSTSFGIRPAIWAALGDRPFVLVAQHVRKRKHARLRAPAKWKDDDSRFRITQSGRRRILWRNHRRIRRRIYPGLAWCRNSYRSAARRGDSLGDRIGAAYLGARLSFSAFTRRREQCSALAHSRAGTAGPRVDRDNGPARGRRRAAPSHCSRRAASSRAPGDCERARAPADSRARRRSSPGDRGPRRAPRAR